MCYCGHEQGVKIENHRKARLQFKTVRKGLPEKVILKPRPDVGKGVRHSTFLW